MGALGIIRKELPKFLQEDQAEGFRNVMGAILPQDLTDVGLMAMTGPGGKLAKLGGLALAGASYSPDAEAGGVGPLLKLMRRLTSEQASLDDMRDLFYKYVKPRGEGSQDQKTIANELLRNIEDDPTAQTHMFTQGPGLSASAAYQLAPRKEGTYLPYLVSFEKGLGHQALEDAYQQAKKQWPEQPVYLYSTPHAEDFYDRQIPRGWVKDTEDGIPRYQRKADGGLVQASRPSHAELYARRGQGDQSVAPAEHRAFAREWTQENPLVAVPSLLAAIPGYYTAKKLGLVRSRTPASVEQVSEAYRGVGEGLAALFDKRRQD